MKRFNKETKEFLIKMGFDKDCNMDEEIDLYLQQRPDFIQMLDKYKKKRGNNMSGKARKKPAVIDFVRFTGSNPTEISVFCGDDINVELSNNLEDALTTPFRSVIIKTLEGNMKAKIGDYIIKGVNGEFYPCNSEIFQKTYDIID